jgi:membrane associated rhomboid family serine protease
MKWNDSLEAKYRHLAIPGLIRMVVALNALTFALGLMNPAFTQYLTLSPALIRQGQLWRLFTFIFIPQTSSIIFLFFGLMFLWYMGDALEQAWGAFKLNLFYFCGMAGVIAAAFLFGGGASGFFLNTSVLFAFATLFPDEVIYLVIIPVKVKWLGLFSFACLLAVFLPAGAQVKSAFIVSFANYLLFFGPALVKNLRNSHAAAARRAEFAGKSLPEDEPLHRCIVCKETEVSNPDLDFRVSKDGNEYCTRHLPGAQPVAANPGA